MIHSIILLMFLFSVGSLSQCHKNDDEFSDFTFPEISEIDSGVYEEIKNTCEEYWDLNNMIDSTFEVTVDFDEFIVKCEGYIDDILYVFYLRVDKDGKWINGWRSPKEH